jgi:signal transduction histidine kinase/CheY-like chemotaxis protein
MPWPLAIPEPADARTRVAMLRQFYDLSRLSLVAASLLVLLHLGFTHGRVPPWAAAIWAAVFAAQIALRAAWRHRVLALDDARLEAESARWTWRAVAGSASTGALWSVALVMAFDPERATSLMYVVMLTCVTVVASINVMAPLPRAFLALALPVVGTVVVLTLGVDSTASLYFAAASAGAGAMAISISFRHARLVHESHALRYEREGLLAQAQQARRAQVRFLAAASHDLRQPVHALGLLAAQLDTRLAGRPEAAAARQLLAMATSLDGLVESLLDVSRLDGSAVPVRPAPMPLQPLFDRLAPEFAVIAESKSLQWRVRPTALWVTSDEALLERLLRNLLANAMGYTPRGGVLLAARRRGEHVAISVWDTGLGIAPEDQARVFEEFVQLRNPGRDRSRGQGLGLAIVARLARLMQHRVHVASRPGRGSRFTVEAPVATPAAWWAAQQAAGGARPAWPAAVAPGGVAPSGLRGLRVALVEDDAAVREATASLLGTWGCEVWADAAAAPLAARLRAAGVRPERIVCDWRLERGDGLEAIVTLREAAAEVRGIDSGDGDGDGDGDGGKGEGKGKGEGEGKGEGKGKGKGDAAPIPALLLSGDALPEPAFGATIPALTAARKPLPAVVLRAWLSAPAPAAPIAGAPAPRPRLPSGCAP